MSARGAWRRSRPLLLLAFAIAFASGVLATAGATIIARARADATPPAESRYFVVARGPLAEATRESLAAHPDAAIVAEHSIDELLGETMSLRTGGDSLRVLEVALPRREPHDAASEIESLQRLDGAVEVVPLTGDPQPTSLRAAPRVIGGALAALGCVLFVAGLLLTASVAVKNARDEIAVRYLLGAEPGGLWRPLGALLGLTVLAGALGAVVATYFAASLLLGRAQPPGEALVMPLAGRIGLLIAAATFVVGAVATAALAARRAVLRITEAPLELLSAVVLAVVLAAGGVARADEAVPSDWQVLRGVGRELAACKRGRLEAERALAEIELAAVRAYARGDAVQLRLATVQRDEQARQLENWRDACAALELRRAELRLLHRASLAPEPSIEPRKPPVTGGLAVAFGEAGLPGKPHAFRNGVGLRVRPGEVVRATAPGKVVFAGDLAGAGKVVVISHGRRTFTVYGRVAEALVVRGMQVEAGEPIADAGSGPAVIYFSVRERGKAVDPVAWLRADPSSGLAG